MLLSRVSPHRLDHHLLHLLHPRRLHSDFRFRATLQQTDDLDRDLHRIGYRHLIDRQRYNTALRLFLLSILPTLDDFGAVHRK